MMISRGVQKAIQRQFSTKAAPMFRTTQNQTHPEDVAFAKRTLGATVVGGSGVFALSRWWKDNKKSEVSAHELAALGEIHIGHIRGNSRDLPMPKERFNGIGISEVEATTDGSTMQTDGLVYQKSADMHWRPIQRTATLKKLDRKKTNKFFKDPVKQPVAQV